MVFVVVVAKKIQVANGQLFLPDGELIPINSKITIETQENSREPKIKLYIEARNTTNNASALDRQWTSAAALLGNVQPCSAMFSVFQINA